MQINSKVSNVLKYLKNKDFENNKIARNEFDVLHNSDSKHANGWTKVAEIPNIVIDQLMREGRWTDRKAMKKWLNDPDNKMFRTTNTKL